MVKLNKKIPVFRVTPPGQAYLNLLVKPRIFSGFLKKEYKFTHFESQLPFKMYLIISFSRKNMCFYPTLKFSVQLLSYLKHIYFFVLVKGFNSSVAKYN